MNSISEKELEALKKALEFEKGMDKDTYTLGWRWYEVGAHTSTINNLIVKGLVRLSYKSRSETRYQLTDEGKARALMLEDNAHREESKHPVEEKIVVAEDMFSDVVGYDGIKELLTESLQLDKPVHVLLVGPPSLAKSVDGSTPIIVLDDSGVRVVAIARVYDEYHAGKSMMTLSVDPVSLKAQFKPITQATKHNVGLGEAVRVRIRSGREIVANKDHSFLKYTDGRLRSVIAGELRVGDLVPVVYKMPELNSGDTHNGFKLSGGLGFLIGMWLAEGSFNRNYTIIGVSDKDEGEGIASLANDQICDGCFWYHDNVYILDGKFQALMFEFLRPGAGEMGVKGTYSNFKTVAPWVFTSLRGFREGVVRGYWQGDGRYDASIGSSSPWLAREMPVLLSTLGIATGTLSTETPYSGFPFHEYRVVGEHIDKFSSIAPSVRAHKSRRGYLLNIPMTHELYSGITKSSPGISARDKEWRAVCGKIEYKAARQGYVSSEYASRLLSYPDKSGEYWRRLQALLGADVFWAPIEEICSCECSTMYDVSVQGNENFTLGNGILTHNSMFLWDIERAYGDLSLPLIGSATSHAGLWDMIAEKRPKIVLVDEIEKMVLADQAALLALMEQGRIIRAKVGRRLDERLTVWVIAAANRTSKMPAELLSRFSIHQLSEYSSSEFKEVVRNVLVAHEDTSSDDAFEIALRLLGKTHDVRDAVRVARLAKRVGVKRAIELLIR